MGERATERRSTRSGWEHRDEVRQIHDRGQYLTLLQAAERYPVFSTRFLRRLVQERRIAFSRVGRSVVLAEADIEEYLEKNRVEPPRWNVAS
jgi:excisionase family DNA binding protein